MALYQRARIYRCARVVTESAEHGTLYHIKDAADMKKAFADRNIARERAQWLFNYDPLKVPLDDEDSPLHARKKPARRLVQPLEARLRHPYQLADLHARGPGPAR